jgi:hypothetical protein
VISLATRIPLRTLPLVRSETGPASG